MAELHERCRHLAKGTANQKRRAWQFLIGEGGLWRGCQEAVHDPSALVSLAERYRILQHEWSRLPLIQAHWGAADAVESQVGAVGRLLAAAIVATLAHHNSPNTSALARWALRSAVTVARPRRVPGWRISVSGREALPSPEPGGENSHRAQDAETRVRRCFAALADGCPERLAELAAAQDAVLSLLRPEDWPSPECRRVPVLLVRGPQGFLAWLWLVRVSGGFGQFFPAPSVLLAPVESSLRQAMEEAWAYVKREREGVTDGTGLVPPSLAAKDGVRWWLDLPREASGAPMPVTGASLQAAAAVGLTLLLEGRPYDPGCAISATVGADGKLGAVAGINGEGAAKLWAAQELRSPNRPAIVVISPGNRLANTEIVEWEARGVRVIVRTWLAEALLLADGTCVDPWDGKAPPEPLPDPVDADLTPGRGSAEASPCPIPRRRPDGPPAPWERRSDRYEILLDNAAERWAARIVPPPDRDRRGEFRRFAAAVAERLSQPDATRAVWTKAEVAQAVREARRTAPPGHRTAAPRETAHALLDNLCTAGILLAAGADDAGMTLRFADPSFAAYLTACALADRLQDEAGSSSTREHVWEALDRDAWDPGRQEVLVFLAGRLTDPVPLLNLLTSSSAAALWGDDFFHHRLTTAVLCLPEIAPESRAALAEVLDSVALRAFSLWWERRRVSAELAGLTGITRALPEIGVLDARMEGTPLPEWLCRRLRAADAGERQAAVDALIHTSRRVAAPCLFSCLAEMLGETDGDARGLALEMLTGLGARAAVPTLLDRLADLLWDGQSAADAALAIRCLGSAAATPAFLARLTSMLDEADPDAAQAAMQAAGGIGSRAATTRILARLEALLCSASLALREAALEAVRCLGSAAATEPLLHGLLDRFSDAHESVREAAAQTLARMGPALSCPVLLTRLAGLLADPDARTRQTAARAARLMGMADATPRALDRLRRQVGRGAAPQRDRFWEGEAPAEPLSGLTHASGIPETGSAGASPSQKRSRWAAPSAPALTDTPRPTTPEQVAEMLGSADVLARDEAAWVAAGLGVAAATPAVLAGLLALLPSPDVRTRQTAAQALGRFTALGVRLFADPGGGWVVRTVAELTQKN